jgi:hypothetical protein
VSDAGYRAEARVAKRSPIFLGNLDIAVAALSLGGIEGLVSLVNPFVQREGRAGDNGGEANADRYLEGNRGIAMFNA